MILKNLTLACGFILAMAAMPTLAQTVVQDHSATTENGTSVAVALTGVTAGDWLIVDVSTSFAETITAPTDNDSDSYTAAVSELPSTGSKAATYYAKVVGGGSVTVTCHISGSSDNVHCHVYEISGLASSSPLDITAKSQTGSTKNLSLTATASTSQADYCHAFFAANNNPNSFTVGSGWAHTQTTSNAGGDAAFSEDKMVTSGVHPSATATASNADTFSQVISCYKPSSGGGCSGQTAFYVATNGSDNNAGTLNAPFLTMTKAQSAMEGSSTKLTYLRTGTYTPALSLTSSDNNETWETYVCDAAQSATIQYNGSGNSPITITGASGITVTNLAFSGGTAGGNGTAGILILSSSSVPSTNIYVTSNKFTNDFNSTADVFVYNSNSIYVQGNTFSTNEYEPVTAHITDNTNHSGLYITDNTMSGFSRMGIEVTVDSNQGSWGSTHIDRNVISVSGTAGNNIGISFVANPGLAQNSCSTVWGNSTTGIPGDGQEGLELASVGPIGTSVEQNTISGVDWPMSISSAVGSEIENNTISNNQQCAFSPDGGYNGTEWIGTNTINGSQVTGSDGCNGMVTSYGTKPAVCTPSPVY